MKVRTVRKHINSYKPQAVKNVGRKYELPDHAARTLIAAGVVEADTGGNAED